jgi:hypothetical protein
MNKLSSVYANDDERGHYNFSFSDSDGKHISVSFRAEPDYDLDIVFQEFQNFLVASGHDVEGPIGELTFEDDDSDDEDYMRSWDADTDEVHAMTQAQAADKFSMDHLPNNGWPFGGLTPTNIAPLTVTDLETNQTYAYKDRLMQNPTMSPITTQQIQSWSLGSAGIQSLTVADLSAWTVPAPGTIGGAKIEFK